MNQEAWQSVYGTVKDCMNSAKNFWVYSNWPHSNRLLIKVRFLKKLEFAGLYWFTCRNEHMALGHRGESLQKSTRSAVPPNPGAPPLQLCNDLQPFQTWGIKTPSLPKRSYKSEAHDINDKQTLNITKRTRAWNMENLISHKSPRWLSLNSNVRTNPHSYAFQTSRTILQCI